MTEFSFQINTCDPHLSTQHFLNLEQFFAIKSFNTTISPMIDQNDEIDNFFLNQTPSTISLHSFKENPQQTQAKSIQTKNICFNICQKTIKVIFKEEYHHKFKVFCQQTHSTPSSVMALLSKEKKSLTGPKALRSLIERGTNQTQSFRLFMRWFLAQKYLRHCLRGDMKDKQLYISYKNEVLMTLLDI